MAFLPARASLGPASLTAAGRVVSRMNAQRQRFTESGERTIELGDPTDESSPRLRPGSEVGGKYVIRRSLGTGAHGVVYEAEHLEVGHRVAIKVVHAAYVDREDMLLRFRREARISGSIREKHIAQVYDVGHLDSGAPYIVMELLEGRSLATLFYEEPALPIATVLELGRQLLHAIGAAHRAGVLHRDIKPENIMLHQESTGDVVLKLLDFGIAKRIIPDLAERSITMEGNVVGTPDYMSPEQLRGNDLDERSDIYAAGVVLYEAITGQPPFEAEHLTELFASVLRDEVVPPSRLRQECSEALERIVLRAMSRSRSQRYPNAEAMSRALAQVMKREGHESAGAWRLEPPQAAWVGKRKEKKEPSATTLEGHVSGIAAAGTAVVGTDEITLPTQRRWPLAASALVLVLALGASLAWWTARGGGEREGSRAQVAAGSRPSAVETPRAEAPLPAPSPPESPPATVTAESPPPATVVVTFVSHPNGVEVRRVGRSAPLGTTPLDVTLERADAVERFEFSKDGYRSLQREISLAADARLLVELRPTPRPRGVRTVRAPPADPEPPPPPAPVAPEAAPAPIEPAVPLRHGGTLDPF